MTTENDPEYSGGAELDYLSILPEGSERESSSAEAEKSESWEQLPDEVKNTENMSTNGNDGNRPQWSFEVIRIIRVLVGVAVLFVLIFDLYGAYERVLQNPELTILVGAAILQFIQMEDIDKIREVFGR